MPLWWPCLHMRTLNLNFPDTKLWSLIHLQQSMGSFRTWIHIGEWLHFLSIACSLSYNSHQPFRGKRSIAEANFGLETFFQKHVPLEPSRLFTCNFHASQGAFFTALDPASEDESTVAILDAITEGEMLRDASDTGIILGAKLAKTLGVRLGKKVVYTLTDRNGEIVSGLARVRGIVTTGAPTVDRGLCMLAIDPVRELLGYRGRQRVRSCGRGHPGVFS